MTKPKMQAVKACVEIAASTEIDYFLLCKKELALKVEIAEIQKKKKICEKELAEENKIGQISFNW